MSLIQESFDRSYIILEKLGLFFVLFLFVVTNKKISHRALAYHSFIYVDVYLFIFFKTILLFLFKVNKP